MQLLLPDLDPLSHVNVMVWGAPTSLSSTWQRGLLDELGRHVVPALLGNGARLFDNLGDAEVQLNRSGPSRHPASPTSSTGW